MSPTSYRTAPPRDADTNLTAALDCCQDDGRLARRARAAHRLRAPTDGRRRPTGAAAAPPPHRRTAPALPPPPRGAALRLTRPAAPTGRGAHQAPPRSARGEKPVSLAAKRGKQPLPLTPPPKMGGPGQVRLHRLHLS